MRFAFHTPLPWAAERTSLFERWPLSTDWSEYENSKAGEGEERSVQRKMCEESFAPGHSSSLMKQQQEFPSCWYWSDTNSHTDINLRIDIWIHQPNTIYWALCPYHFLIVLNCTISVDLLWFPCISQLFFFFFLKRGGIIWASFHSFLYIKAAWFPPFMSILLFYEYHLRFFSFWPWRKHSHMFVICAPPKPRKTWSSCSGQWLVFPRSSLKRHYSRR